MCLAKWYHIIWHVSGTGILPTRTVNLYIQPLKHRHKNSYCYMFNFFKYIYTYYIINYKNNYKNLNMYFFYMYVSCQVIWQSWYGVLQELGYRPAGSTWPSESEWNIRWFRQGNESLHLRLSLLARPLLSDDGHALCSVAGSRHASCTWYDHCYASFRLCYATRFTRF